MTLLEFRGEAIDEPLGTMFNCSASCGRGQHHGFFVIRRGGGDNSQVEKLTDKK